MGDAVTYQPDEGGFPQICPYLGLGDDADSHATYATEAHRCYNLANPTKIALPHQETYCLVANHLSCPVYQGQGVPQPRGGQGAAPPPPAAAPFGQGRPPARAQDAAAAARAQAARKRPPTLNPRPRGGGISMPAATIALFVLAIAVIALAVLVTQLAGGGGDDDLTPAEAFQTTQARQTQAPSENTPEATTATGQETSVAGAPTDEADSEETAVPTEEPAGDETIYVIESGDICQTIADAHGITVGELLDANGMAESDCNSLQVGAELIIPG